MLNLKNIKFEGKVVSADYYPEAETIPSHIVIDLDTGETTQLTEGPGSWAMYSSHAARALIEMFKTGDHRDSRLVMWY